MNSSSKVLVGVICACALVFASCGEAQTPTSMTQSGNLNSANTTTTTIANADGTTTTVQTTTGAAADADRKNLQSAVLSMEASSCDKIVDTRQKQSCQVAVYNALATKNLDTSYCGKLNSDVSRDACKKGVIFQKSIKEEKVDLCNSLSEDISKKDCSDNFYMMKAVKDTDASQCDKIENNDQMQICRDQLLVSGLDWKSVTESTCTPVKSPSVQVECTKQVVDIIAARKAIEDKDEKACDKVQTVGMKEYCKNEAGLARALDKKDEKMCAALSEALTYEKLAENKNYKKECEDNFKK